MKRFFLEIKTWSFLFCLSVLLGGITRGNQQGQNEVRSLMELGKSYYEKATAGDEAAAEKAYECFDKAFSLDSTNAVALVYRGAVMIQRAQFTWWLPSKFSRVKQGGHDMDWAVSMVPNDMNVRLMRAMSSLTLSGIFSKLRTAIEDFDVLLANSELPKQSFELQSAIYYYAGLAYRRDDQIGKAKTCFQRAVFILPGSETAEKAKEELQELK
ncbi:MAG: hypothetical protein HY276_12600 [Ignavibacteriales bacterium]|nr:hypothetical protein [Ignavibacteriales bacterium]